MIAILQLDHPAFIYVAGVMANVSVNFMKLIYSYSSAGG
jgi:hypothetical protein